jgi:hypothetical protein
MYYVEFCKVEDKNAAEGGDSDEVALPAVELTHEALTPRVKAMRVRAREAECASARATAAGDRARTDTASGSMDACVRQRR